MKPTAIIFLSIEAGLLILILGSFAFLSTHSRDFLLAKRQATLPMLQPGVAVAFSEASDGDGTLLGNWDRSRPPGALAKERTAVLALKLPEGHASILTFDGRFLASAGVARGVDVALDDQSVATLAVSNLSSDAECSWSIMVPPPATALSLLRFTVAPAAFTIGQKAPDQNRLMLGLAAMTMTTTAATARCDGGAGLEVIANTPANSSR